MSDIRSISVHFRLESLIASLPDRQVPATKNQRSFSTTALPSGHPQRKNSRERKTVASLHPLTPHDVQCLTSLHEVATRGNGLHEKGQKEQEEGEQQEPTIKEEEEEEVRLTLSTPAQIYSVGTTFSQ